MKFTKEEIDLCKQVAERWKKPIEHGDWFIDTKIGGKPFLSVALKVPIGNLVPLWAISDCLEFLRKGFHYITLTEYKDNLEIIIKEDRWDLSAAIISQGKTPLEACLKAILAVFGEQK